MDSGCILRDMFNISLQKRLMLARPGIRMDMGCILRQMASISIQTHPMLVGLDKQTGMGCKATAKVMLAKQRSSQKEEKDCLPPAQSPRFIVQKKRNQRWLLPSSPEERLIVISKLQHHPMATNQLQHPAVHRQCRKSASPTRHLLGHLPK